MEDFADLNRRLESLIRYGAILDVQMDPPRVRVQSGGLQTQWLPFFALRAGDTAEWDPPTKGEQCMILSPSGDPATGAVLVGLYSARHPAPSKNPDEHVRTYPDGARIGYNHATSALSATGIKTALVQAANSVTVDCPETTITGNVTIRGRLTVVDDALFQAAATVNGLFTFCGGMFGKAAAGVKTIIQTSIEHIGDFINKGAISSNGVNLSEHDHPDAHGGNTGKPNK